MAAEVRPLRQRTSVILAIAEMEHARRQPFPITGGPGRADPGGRSCDRQPATPAQDSLPLAVGILAKRSVEGSETSSCIALEVAVKRLCALVPTPSLGRVSAGPITSGHLGETCFGFLLNSEDIPLRDAHMLQQLPRRIRHSGSFCRTFAQAVRRTQHQSRVGTFSFEEVH